MKPVKLVISGWGPYKDKEEIDFRKISERQIFLITGATGAGKTTIFDAITYALYGDLSGSLRQKNTVRSDFADVGTQTFVEFSMEHDGQYYQIRRNPEYQRPRKRKGGKESFVTEKENAVLWLPDSSVLEGNREVNEKIREILRLDLRQFRQISMIAQGEFAQLLHAGGDEKLKIFREIFGTGIYDLFLKKLKEKAAVWEKSAMEYLHRMEEDVRLFPAEDERLAELTRNAPYPYREIAALLLTMEKEAGQKAEKIGQKRADCEEQIRQETAQLAVAERINERFEQLQRQKNRQQNLRDMAEEMDGLERKCLRAAAASRVYEVYRQMQQTNADLERQNKQLDSQIMQLEEMKSRQNSFETAARKESEMERLFEAQDRQMRAKQQLDEEKKALEKANVRLKAEQKNYLTAEENVRKRQLEFEDLQRAQQYSMIGLVACLVREGEPCPVCGSVEHPHVAVQAEGPEEGALEKAAERLETARSEKMRCHGEARAALETYEKAKARFELALEEEKGVREELEKLKQELDAIRLLLGEWPAPAQFRKRMRQYHEMEAAIGEKEKNCLQIRENIVFLAERKQDLSEQYALCRKRQGFIDEEDWQSALMEERLLEQTQQSLAQYKEDVRVGTELISHLEEELAGKKPTDTRQGKEFLAARQQESKDLLTQQQKQQMLKDQAGRTGRSLTENLKKAGDAQAVYGVVKDLENMASGNNSRRLVFEQYVLAGYFDDILRAANLRLKNMSGGRYELFRTDRILDGRKKDSLEIEVMDYYTGRKRSVRTLSGGETFKASLALALGLSDAVCAASGGVKVDTLFVDEGFGALDAQSLDQACSALMSLAGENRLIGIISHVAELKERIPTQILVEKETAGSRIRVKI